MTRVEAEAMSLAVIEYQRGDERWQGKMLKDLPRRKRPGAKKRWWEIGKKGGVA